MISRHIYSIPHIQSILFKITAVILYNSGMVTVLCYCIPLMRLRCIISLIEEIMLVGIRNCIMCIIVQRISCKVVAIFSWLEIQFSHRDALEIKTSELDVVCCAQSIFINIHGNFLVVIWRFIFPIILFDRFCHQKDHHLVDHFCHWVDYYLQGYFLYKDD